MDFEKQKALPGCIIDVDDPKQIGRVKCDVPSLFNSSEMNKEGLPWIYPLHQAGYQRYSAPIVGQKVWVVAPKEFDHLEYWYWPMAELTADTKGIISDDNYETAEVLISRNCGALSVFAYYNKTDGIMLKLGDSASVNINANGEVLLQSGTAKVQLRNNHVYLGDGGEGESAVLGDTLKKLLEDLQKKLFAASSAAMESAYTSNMALPLVDCAMAIGNTVENILCTNTNVD